MTRDTIINLAREVGMERIVGVYKDGTRMVEVPNLELLERFAALVAAAERDACAELCDEQAIRSEASMRKAKTVKARDIYSSAGQTAHWMAQAIRARKGNQ